MYRSFSHFFCMDSILHRLFGLYGLIHLELPPPQQYFTQESGVFVLDLKRGGQEELEGLGLFGQWPEN